jgi:hypothetical protein
LIGELDYVAIGVILIEYLMITVHLLQRRNAVPSDVSLRDAFIILERCLRQAYPDLPEGFTWKEAISKIKSSSGDEKTDWGEIDALLEKYEAFRYGGLDYQSTDVKIVLRLAKRLERRKGLAR